MKLAMLIPTRWRPTAAREAAETALALAGGDTTIHLCVDGDDDPGYRSGAFQRRGIVRRYASVHSGMIATLNRAALAAVHERLDDEDPYTHVGFMGDDHRPRTLGWDQQLMAAAGDGLAYGNDLLRGAELPTAVVMHVDIVRALGRMAPETLGHMYCDDYWLALGNAGVGIRYVPEVVIEHLHPAAGKAQMDASYELSNHPDRYAEDASAWALFKAQGGVENDVEAIRRHRVGRAG